MKYTEEQNECLRAEMSNFESNGWRPEKKEFVIGVANMQANWEETIPDEIVGFWYDERYDCGEGEGEIPDYMLEKY